MWGIDGDWMVGYIPKDIPFYPTDHCGVIRVLSNKIDTYYLSLVLEQVGVLHGFSRTYRASTERISSVQIPLPPHEVQQKIVEECKKIDEEIDLLQATINKLSVIDVLTEAKAHNHQMMSISELCTISAGGTPSRSNGKYWNGDIPWVKSEVCKGFIVTSAKEFITDEGFNNSSARMFHKGTTLIALVGATKGKTALLGIDACTNQNIAGLQVKDTRIIIPEYLFVACRSNYKSFIEGLTSYDMLNQNNLGSKKIPVPSLEVQKQIIAHAYKSDKQIAELAKLREEAPSRKQAILDKYLK